MNTAIHPQMVTQPVAVQAARYVRIQLFCLMTGFTPKAVERKIEDGKWVEGKHYRRRDGAILIDMNGYEAWARGER